MKKLKVIVNSLLIGLLTVVTANLAVGRVQAQLTNPVVEGALGSDAEGAAAGTTFATYFVSIWSSVISIGAILVLVFFIWGALEWITSGGDKGKLENARNRITQAVVGLIILVGSFVILGFISDTFFGRSFNLLEIGFPNVLEQ
jgi:NADH:ubiquinone oxidoreductase subunit 6 (subunit J)